MAKVLRDELEPTRAEVPSLLPAIDPRIRPVNRNNEGITVSKNTAAGTMWTGMDSIQAEHEWTFFPRGLVQYNEAIDDLDVSTLTYISWSRNTA